jgi:hypothetical protein
VEVWVGGKRGASMQVSHRRKPSRRGLHLVVIVLVPLYLALVTAMASLVHSSEAAPAAQRPRPAHSHPAAVPDQGLAVVNRTRAGQGRPQLRFSAAAAGLARLQSLAMARERRLFHQSCLACTKLRMVWGSIEVNVGSGTSAQAVYQQLTHGHARRANVLCRCVTQGGTAMVRSGGRVWVTEIFFRPSSRILLGARAQPRPTDPVVTGDPDKDALVQLEAEIGRKLAIDHLYVHLGTPLPYSRFAWDRANGRLPLVDWDLIDPFYTWSQIATGKADRIINADARAAAAYKGPILLSFHHEPEYGVPRYGTPAQFVAAWRHVVDRFRAAGATNVLWIWILGSEVFRQGAADGWFPGRSYVDYVGADGYNYAFAKAGAQWRTVGDLFNAFYAWSVEKHLPAMITETGCLEDPGDPGRKAGWFNDADAWLHTHPDIKAFVYFNTTVRWPWFVDTSSQSLQAFSALANDPLFR